MTEDAGPVVLGLGTNRAWGSLDCFALIDEAVGALDKVLSGMKRASLYETEPQGVRDQDRFLNTAVSGFYAGAPEELLALIHQIEAQFGRDRSQERRWGERSLDIDILLFGNLTLSTADLVIPHPRLEERQFALEPLLELLPAACSPLSGVPYREICDQLPDQGVRKRNLE